MPVSAQDAAREVRRRLPGVGTKKLHKLLYLCQGHHLAFSDEPLFDESISAWDHGPVVGSLWKREKDGAPISAARELDEAQLNTIGYVLSRYGRLSGRDLEDLAHAQVPWREADSARPPGTSVRIEMETLRTFFRADQDDSEDAAPLDRESVRRWLVGAVERRQRPSSPDTIEGLRRRLGHAG